MVFILLPYLVRANRARRCRERVKQGGGPPGLCRSDPFSRIAYQMVAGGQVCRHPAIQQRSYILEKLLAFHTTHATPLPQTLADVQATIDQLPKNTEKKTLKN